MITGVAILDGNGKIWFLSKPNRHHHIIHSMYLEIDNKKIVRKILSNHKQGFITESGEFIDRKTAFMEALRCRQVLHPYNPTPRDLFSEDLW